MFVTLFAFAFLATYVAAEIPSYIHVCGRRDPNLEECILNNVLNLREKICQGIPELSIKSSEPLVFDKIMLINTPTSKVFLKNTELFGLCDYTINSLHVDVDNYHFDADLTFKQIKLNSTFDYDVRILVSIASNGSISITSDNVDAKIGIDMRVLTKGAKQHFYLSRMTTKLDIKGYEATMGSMDNDQINQLQQAVSNFLGDNQKEIIETLKPIIEDAVSRETLRISNEIVKHFTYEEIFPERT